ncbi:MAG: lipase family protein [Nocardioides sp.]|uniref:lipase family protein n=1 Tax=Nocardioides sp. TaxID=35761 RepID=UPI003F0554B9
MPLPASLRTRLRRRAAELPRWARLLVAAAVVALGLAVVARPTTALGSLALLLGAGMVVLGALELLPDDERDDAGGRRTSCWLGLAWVAAGVFVLAFLGLTVRLLAAVVGVALVVHGVVQAARGVRATERDRQVSEVAFGLAGVVLGVLALLWPDITLIVACLALGVRLVMAGATLAWRTLRPAAPAAPPGTLPTRHGWRRTVGAVLALVLALGAAGLSAVVRGGSPVVDEFYAAPRTVPDQPGRLVRSEPFTRGVPDGALGWRILYTTRTGDGEPSLASGLVVVPAEGEGGWPVVSWAHGTTGVARQCAPSLASEPFESGAMFVLPRVVEEGWALVASDYPGLGTDGTHPYLIGEDTAWSVLDATTAARELTEARLGTDTVVWGHSQGGGAALWTAQLEDEWRAGLDAHEEPAPELLGVAALAPAADLPGLVSGLDGVTGGSVLEAYVFHAFQARYPEITFRRYVRPGAEETVRAFASRCLAEPGILVSVLQALALSRDPDVLSSAPLEGALGRRLTENVPAPRTSVPLLVGQGIDDGLISDEVQSGYVGRLCRDGQVVDLRRYPGRDHVPLVEEDSPAMDNLFAWTQERLDREPAPRTCHVTTR